MYVTSFMLNLHAIKAKEIFLASTVVLWKINSPTRTFSSFKFPHCLTLSLAHFFPLSPTHSLFFFLFYYAGKYLHSRFSCINKTYRRERIQIAANNNSSSKIVVSVSFFAFIVVVVVSCGTIVTRQLSFENVITLFRYVHEQSVWEEED